MKTTTTGTFAAVRELRATVGPVPVMFSASWRRRAAPPRHVPLSVYTRGAPAVSCAGLTGPRTVPAMRDLGPGAQAPSGRNHNAETSPVRSPPAAGIASALDRDHIDTTALRVINV